MSRRDGWGSNWTGRHGAEHGHQRAHPGAAGDKKQRATGADIPHEIATDRAAELQPVAGAQLAGEVLGDLTINQAFHRHRQRFAGVGRRRDRVAALRPIAVAGGETDIDVLPREVARPPRHSEDDAADPSRFIDDIGDVAEAPAQSPLYRCSSHGSPYMW